MTTTQLLEEVQASLKAVGIDADIDKAAGTVDVAVDHHQAFMAVEVSDARGMYWEVSWAMWDRTGGVADERWLADVRLEQLPVVMRSLLDEERARQEKLQAELDAIADDDWDEQGS
jgi:hypothetical protein